jgi:hypothetical protein
MASLCGLTRLGFNPVFGAKIGVDAGLQAQAIHEPRSGVLMHLH